MSESFDINSEITARIARAIERGSPSQVALTQKVDSLEAEVKRLRDAIEVLNEFRCQEIERRLRP